MKVRFLTNNHIKFLEEITFTYRGIIYTIEKGYITNGGSLPRLLWVLSHPFFYPYLLAYIIHDYMYSNKFKLVITRKEADEFFLYNLSLHNKIIGILFYIGVRIGGKKNFKTDLPFNKKEIKKYYINNLDYKCR